jgi:hypothetical protein
VPETCGQPTPTGAPCAYAAARCPRHAAPPPPPKPGDTPNARVRVDLHNIAHAALSEAAAAEADPLQTARLLRAVHSAHALGQGPVEEHRAMVELQLRGRLMTGLPPDTDEGWYRLADFLNDEAMLEIETWAVNLPDCVPPWGFHPQEIWLREGSSRPWVTMPRKVWHAAVITRTGRIRYVHPHELDQEHPELVLIPRSTLHPDMTYKPDKWPHTPVTPARKGSGPARAWAPEDGEEKEGPFRAEDHEPP